MSASSASGSGSPISFRISSASSMRSREADHRGLRGIPNSNTRNPTAGTDATNLQGDAFATLAAVTGAREMLLAMQRSGNDKDYFAQQKSFADAEAWYKKLGVESKKH
jgi:hypothetical protein